MILARTRVTPARDVTCLIDHLGLDQVDLAGYSVGSMIGLRVLQADRRVRRAVLGGVGDGILRLDPRMRERVAADLAADDLTALSRPGRAMRERISRLGGDHLALAATWAAPFVEYDAGFGHVRADVLIITGERDLDFGDPAALAARLPAARVSRPPADHASTMNHHVCRDADRPPDRSPGIAAGQTAPARPRQADRPGTAGPATGYHAT